MRRLLATRFPSLAAMVVFAAFATAPAFAAPGNDDFANATEISSLPFPESGDLDGAGVEPGEQLFCAFMQQTAWYKVSVPVTTPLRIEVSPALPFNLYVSSGGGIGNLGFLGCNNGPGGAMEFIAGAGSTYYIQLGSFNTGPAPFQIGVSVVPPPPNDSFANGTSIGSLPFSETADLTGATLEAGEPSSGINASVWYAVSTVSPVSLTASVGGPCCSFPVVAVYTGQSLGQLSLLGSGGFFQPVTFHAEPGTTYLIQVGAAVSTNSTATLQVIETPPVVPNFSYSPFDPSTFDTVQFFDQTSDPGQAGIQSWQWQFGDGTTGTGNAPIKAYAADGDYTVRMTVTTVDGRTGTATQTVHVRTHDVAIAKLTVPKSASAGQTREITVGIRNYRYPDMVQVQLLKSVPGQGFLSIGSLMQLIPIRQGNGTTPVSFSYTFGNDDATVGKVSFEAIVTILGARDMLPADNTAISTPTKVSR
jgi:PKD repeat protein